MDDLRVGDPVIVRRRGNAWTHLNGKTGVITPGTATRGAKEGDEFTSSVCNVQYDHDSKVRLEFVRDLEALG